MESEENSNNQNADGDDQTGGGGSVCHDDSWVWYMNRCLKIVESKKTWTEARTECQGAAQSADLLSIGKNNVHFPVCDISSLLGTTFSQLSARTSLSELSMTLSRKS